MSASTSASLPLAPVRVLVVDDSAVARQMLVHLLSADPAVEVVATAANGREALVQVQRHHPDVITMDINMPQMDGFEATRLIMENAPMPIVVITASENRNDVAFTFRALEAGALTIIEKPSASNGAAARDLVETVKLMAEVKVVRRWPRRETQGAASAAQLPRGRPTRLVAIGASTGGPQVLHAILAGLGADFPLPVVIVQHIAAGFAEGLAQWLERATGFAVHLAVHGEALQPGRAYVAPEGRQLRLEGDAESGHLALSADPPEHGHRPSVSYFFRSVARVAAQDAVGVLLSGMGRDGAAELRQLRECGAVTIVQSRESSVVAGMPGAAIELDAACHVLAPEAIAPVLRELAGCSPVHLAVRP